VDTVVLNVELGHPEIDLIRQYFAEGDYLAVLEILAANRDRERFAASCLRMRQIVDDLHARGYLVQATTYPFILDDQLDGDPDLQDIAEVPLDGADWDIRGFTPYTTAYADDLGVPIGPYFVFDYARTARELFGAAAAIAVGIVDVDALPGYTSPDQLAADVAAAKAAGVRRIDVYHLLGMVENGEFDAWADALLAEPAEPPIEAAVVLMRAAIGLADDLLDFWPER
jgi:hypothetical protein